MCGSYSRRTRADPRNIGVKPMSKLIFLLHRTGEWDKFMICSDSCMMFVKFEELG